MTNLPRPRMTSWPFSLTYSPKIHPMIYFLYFTPLSIFRILSPPLFRFLPLFPVKDPLSKKTAKLKTLLNRRACLKRIPHRLFQAYATPTLPDAEALSALYRLSFAAHYRDSIERNWRHDPLDTKRPSETQYAYLDEKPSLYTTQWNITSDQIRERI